MVRPDGYVKVLDFGLVKLMPSDDGVTRRHPHRTGTCARDPALHVAGAGARVRH